MCTIIEEEWRDIAGYEGIYKISNLGRVKSLNCNRSSDGQILKQHVSNKGYVRVLLYKNGKYKHPSIHRLVAAAFIPNQNNLPEVNHRDENTQNNRVDNLEWCDRKYNVNYGTGMRRMLDSRTGPKKERPVMCVETGIVYPSSQEASRKTGVHQGNINGCCRGKRNTSGGDHWKYCD